MNTQMHFHSVDIRDYRQVFVLYVVVCANHPNKEDGEKRRRKKKEKSRQWRRRRQWVRHQTMWYDKIKRDFCCCFSHTTAQVHTYSDDVISTVLFLSTSESKNVETSTFMTVPLFTSQPNEDETEHWNTHRQKIDSIAMISFFFLISFAHNARHFRSLHCFTLAFT